MPGLSHAVHDQVHLLEALLARDANRAQRLMREHVQAFQREILAAYSRAADERRNGGAGTTSTAAG